MRASAPTGLRFTVGIMQNAALLGQARNARPYRFLQICHSEQSEESPIAQSELMHVRVRWDFTDF